MTLPFACHLSVTWPLWEPMGAIFSVTSPAHMRELFASDEPREQWHLWSSLWPPRIYESVTVLLWPWDRLRIHRIARPPLLLSRSVPAGCPHGALCSPSAQPGSGPGLDVGPVGASDPQTRRKRPPASWEVDCAPGITQSFCPGTAGDSGDVTLEDGGRGGAGLFLTSGEQSS